jgi:hypothetical protein
MGGPGYKFEDETKNPSHRFDKPGKLAMANAGPNTNGSQFFITVASTKWLNGKHTIFGEVVEGYDIVVKISKVRRDHQDRPKKDVVLTSLTIKRTWSAVPVVGSLSDVVSRIGEVAKLGNRVTLTNVQEIQSVLNGKHFRLKAEVTFNVVDEDSLPALTNISGVSVHELVWIDIRSMQVKQNGGSKIVRVVTSEGTKDVALGWT